MKSRLLVSAAILALIAASPALADKNDSSNDRDKGAHQSHDAGTPRGDRQGGAPVQNTAPSGGEMRGGRHDQGGAASTVAPSGGGMTGERAPRPPRSRPDTTGPAIGGPRRRNP